VPETIHPFMRCDPAAFGKPVPRLGLASHDGSSLTVGDIHHAFERGVRFLNWSGLAEGFEAGSAGGADAFRDAIATLGTRRDDAVICAQFGVRTAADARLELDALLAALRTDYVDVLTLYWVESREEWDALRAPGGALELCRDAKRDGVVRRIGVTSHQRPLAAEMSRSGELDVLMVRYNAAHRGAERDVFPVAEGLRVPIISFTATRWNALLRRTPSEPRGFEAPRAPEWYRFALQQPAVSVALCAPHSRAELDEDLTVLHATGPLAPDEYARLAEHGELVRKHASEFT
jgi:aryl-alcohol dehydrogenase-like predicted oxidoreductase